MGERESKIPQPPPFSTRTSWWVDRRLAQSVEPRTAALAGVWGWLPLGRFGALFLRASRTSGGAHLMRVMYESQTVTALDVIPIRWRRQKDVAPCAFLFFLP